MHPVCTQASALMAGTPEAELDIDSTGYSPDGDDPADWIHYGPPTGPHTPPFAEFHRGPRFAVVQRQIFDRLDQCIAFAESHFGTFDASRIKAPLKDFKRFLADESDAPAVNMQYLPLIYGLCKQSLDSLCLLLDHHEAGRGNCPVALRELSKTIRARPPFVPAFTEAVTDALKCEGGLRQRFGHAMRQLLDARTRRFVREQVLPRETATPCDLEHHVLHHLRLVLGLPDLDPRVCYGRPAPKILGPDHVIACAQALMLEGGPAAVARQLARDFRSEVLAQAGSRLGVPTEDLDPNDPRHQQELVETARALGVEFGGLSFHDLVQGGDANRRFVWRGGDSLLAPRLLQALVSQGLLNESVADDLRGTSLPPDGLASARAAHAGFASMRRQAPGAGDHGQNLEAA